MTVRGRCLEVWRADGLRLLGCSLGCEVDVDVEWIGCSGPEDVGCKRWVVSVRGWSVLTTGLLCCDGVELSAGDEYVVSVSTEEMGMLTGSVVLGSVVLAGTVGGLARVRCRMNGTGYYRCDVDGWFILDVSRLDVGRLM